MSDGHAQGAGRRLATFATLLLLVALLVQWTSSQLRSEMGALGERMWPGYGVELREEPERPVPPTAVEVTANPTTDKAVLSDSESGDEALEEDDLLGDLDDLLEDEDVKSEAQLAEEKHAAALEVYEQKLAAYERALERRTPTLRVYAAVDLALFSIFTWLSEHFRPLFILLLGLGGVIATAGRHHISLRQIRGRRSDRFAQGGALLANLLLIASVVSQHRSRLAAGTLLGEGTGLEAALWVGAFAAMALCNLVYLARPVAADLADSADPEGGRSLSYALLSIPLYAVMAVIAGAYFLLAEGYLAGLAVYLEKLLSNVQLYLQVGLYVWVGMLLKRTRLATLAFAVVRPWRLPPELLAIVVVLLAAIPTAYSGASGIFVIAAGALIFRELSAAGARPSLALASTAMSGSMGVVLSPCLLVVIISYLSGAESDLLFHWGRLVFLLSAVLFAGLVVLTRRGPLRPRPIDDAWRQSGQALRA
ncbi:MAG TPA: C4-dicarboxylate ABC transporter, partial [Nannocystis exedens]|nr:C4-dicarboxylate ABC transporter [Nannocystis exedens]